MSGYIREKKIINVNSGDATIFRNGSFLSDLTFSFPHILSYNDDVEYFEGALESAVFPVSFYIINYSNNTLGYTIQDHSGIQRDFIINIPVGNYDYESLFVAMHTALNSNGHHFTLTLNETNGIMTMQYNPTAGRSFIGIKYSLSTCFRVLGFDYRLNYNATSNILVAPFALNLLGIKKLKIYCPQFSSSNLETTNYSTTSLISTIINDQPPWGQINYYNNSGEFGSRLRVFEINNLDIRVTDEFGALVNFNNCDWSMTFILITFRTAKNRTIEKLPMISQDDENYIKEKNDDENENKNKNKNENDEQNNKQNDEQDDEPMNRNMEDLDFLIRSNPNYFN
jgi:hypothetical protein